MFGLGIPELIVIFIIALVVFGPKKLPELGKSVGRAMAEFKKAQQEFQDSVKSEMREVEKTAELDKLKELGKDIDLKAYGASDTAKPQQEPTLEQKPEQKPDHTTDQANNEGTKANG